MDSTKRRMKSSAFLLSYFFNILFSAYYFFNVTQFIKGFYRSKIIYIHTQNFIPNLTKYRIIQLKKA